MSERHVFLPVVTLTEREDGRYDVDIDWTGAYDHTTPEGGESREYAQGEDRYDAEPGTPGDNASRALDAWVETQNNKFTIPPMETGTGTWQVTYEIRSMIDPDDSFPPRRVTIAAPNAKEASRLTVEWVRLNDPHYDDRIDPVCEIRSVIAKEE